MSHLQCISHKRGRRRTSKMYHLTETATLTKETQCHHRTNILQHAQKHLDLCTFMKTVWLFTLQISKSPLSFHRNIYSVLSARVKRVFECTCKFITHVCCLCVCVCMCVCVCVCVCVFMCVCMYACAPVCLVLCCSVQP